MFRIRPRFSLRTLLFGVLTAASAVTLWMHHEPWRLERTYPGKTLRGAKATFSPDGKWVHLNVRRDDPSRRITYSSLLCNIQTGQSTVLIDKVWENQEDEQDNSRDIGQFTSDSSVLLAGISDGDRTIVTLCDLPSLTQRAIPASVKDKIRTARIMYGDRYAHFHLHGKRSVLMDLQNNTAMFDDENVKFTPFKASRDRFAAVDAEGSACILDASTQREIQRIRPPTDWNFRYVEYLVDNTLLVHASMTEYDEFDSDCASLRFDLRDPGNPQIIPGELTSVSPDDTFHIFEYRDQLAVVLAADAKELYRITNDWAGIKWFPDSKRFYTFEANTAYDARTGRVSYRLSDGQIATFSEDHTRVLYLNYATKNYYLHDGENGAFLQALPGSVIGSHNHQQGFSPDGTHLYNYVFDTGAIQIWKRYRPEYWWGLVCLPEFWLITVFAVAFFWSLRRDWRDWRDTNQH
jgi:hypothetical protein